MPKQRKGHTGKKSTAPTGVQQSAEQNKQHDKIRHYRDSGAEDAVRVQEDIL